MKVRFKSRVSKGFSFSPLRGSLTRGKIKKNLWDQGRRLWSSLSKLNLSQLHNDVSQQFLIIPWQRNNQYRQRATGHFRPAVHVISITMMDGSEKIPDDRFDPGIYSFNVSLLCKSCRKYESVFFGSRGK